MPLYEYQCEGCGEVFERMQKFSDEPISVHDKCGAHVHRLISAPAFQFKGSGWYVTDYARAGNGSKAGDSEKKADSDKKDGGEKAKTDAKPSQSKPAAVDKPKSD